MRKFFKSTTHLRDDGWMMADAGHSMEDGQSYAITTNALKGDEIPTGCSDSKHFSELAAGLLNCYINSVDASKLSVEAVCALGVIPESEVIPHPDNTKIPFPDLDDLPF